MSEYGWIFAAGAASSMHCVGMCGGFALALGLQRGRPLLRQALYNFGRVNALMAIGALCGAAGGVLLTSLPFAAAERVLALLAGVLMLLIGVENLGYGWRWSGRAAAWLQSNFSGPLGGVTRSGSLAAPLAFGVFNAFLPCGLIYAFAARAAATASGVEGAMVMLAFGLGTVPAMMAVGLAGRWLAPARRAQLAVAGSLLVIGFAFVTICRGLGVDVYGWIAGAETPHCHPAAPAGSA